jgi:hypothetical protein
MRHRPPVRRPLGRMFARPYFFSEAHSGSQHHSILSVMNVHSPPSITVKYPRSKRPCLPLLLLASASASRAQLACHGGHAGRTRPHSSPGTSGHEAATPRSGATAAARRLRARPLARAWRVALWEGAILVLALQGTTRPGANGLPVLPRQSFSLFDRRRDVVRGSARRQRSSSRQIFFARRQQRCRSACASASPRRCLLPAFRSNRAGLLQQRRGACCAVLGYCRQNRSLN